MRQLRQFVRWTRNIVFLTGFMFFGFWLASSYGEALFAASIPETPRAVTHGQVNLLIAWVDTLQPNARLNSVWLAGYFPGRFGIAMTPIYLAQAPEVFEQSAVLRQQFALDAKGNLISAFREAVEQQHNTWVNGFIIVDEIGFVEIIDFFGGIPIDSVMRDGIEVLDYIAGTPATPQAALQGQFEVVSGLCVQAGKHDPDLGFERLLRLYPQHLATDQDLFQLAAGHKALLIQGKGLGCEFPSLNLNR